MRVSSREYKFHTTSREDLESNGEDGKNQSTPSDDSEEHVTQACHEFVNFLADAYEIFMSWAISWTGRAFEGRIHAQLSGEVWIPTDLHLVRLVAILLLGLLAPLLLIIVGFYVSFTIPQDQCGTPSAKRIQMLVIFCTSAGFLGMPWLGIHQVSQGQQLWYVAGHEALSVVELVGPLVCSVLLAAMLVDQVLEHYVEEAIRAEIEQTFLEIADTVSPGLATDWNQTDLAAVQHMLGIVLGKKKSEGKSAFLCKRTSNHRFWVARGPETEPTETQVFYESNLEAYILQTLADTQTSLEQKEIDIAEGDATNTSRRRRHTHKIEAELQAGNSHRGFGSDTHLKCSSIANQWDRPITVIWILLAATTQAFLPIFRRFWTQGCSSLQPAQHFSVQALRISYILASSATMVVYFSWATTSCFRLWQLKLKVLTILYLSATPVRRRHLLTNYKDDFKNVFYFRQTRGGLIGNLSDLDVQNGDQMEKGDNDDIRTPLSWLIHVADIFMSIGLVGKMKFVKHSENGFVCDLGHGLNTESTDQFGCYVCVRRQTEYKCTRCLGYLCRHCVEGPTNATDPILDRLQKVFENRALIGLSPQRFLLLRQCLRAVASTHGMQAQSIAGIAVILIASKAVAAGVIAFCEKKMTTGLVVCTIGLCLDMCVIVMTSYSLIQLNQVLQVVTLEVINGWRTRIVRLHASVQGFVDGNSSDRLTIDSRFHSIQQLYDFAINYLKNLELPLSIYEIPVTNTFCTRILMIVGSAVLSSMCTYAVQMQRFQSFVTMVWTQ